MTSETQIITDLHLISFSRRGAWTAIKGRWDYNENKALPGASFHTARSQANAMPNSCVFDLVFTAGGQPTEVTSAGDGALLRFTAATGTIEACMPGEMLTRLRGRGLGLRLEQQMGTYDHACPVPGGRLRIMSSSRGMTLLITPVKGALKLISNYGPKTPPWGASATEVIIETAPDANGEWDIAIEDWEGAWTGEIGPQDFEAALAIARADFDTFCAAAPAPEGSDARLHRLGNYILWSIEASPRNAFKTPAWFVSKSGFVHVYSWDSAFTTLGMWPTHPDKAWQCFMVVLENQHPSGMVCSPCMETGPNYRFTNPPVHGWVLSRMRQIRELSREQCAQVYLLLVAYSNWWLNARDDDRDGLPCYFHGNDTGWDNSTIFDRTPTVTSPDLATLLALQFDELACLAERLGKPHEAAQHRAQANLLIERMIEKLWTGEAFIALGHDGENCVGDGDCLLLQFPIMLGQRLPRMIREKLIANLSDEERFLCTAGFATESQRSPLFDPSGYWRGPVWPPPMAMLCHGLIDAGAETLARTAASRFITAIARTGYCENHNAKTGDGLCHPFMPWTVAVYRDLQRVIETEGNAVR